MATTKSGGQRLAYLDWMRGIAALIMLQGHVFHSFTAKDERESGIYVLSQFVGGLAPAVFIFLTGVTLAFMMDSRSKRGANGRERMMAVLRRAGYFWGIAFLFRLQLWAFAAGQSPWTDLFKVDVLNCMALTVTVLSPLALLDTGRRARWAAVAGLAIAAAGPVVSALDFAGWPAFVRTYLAPDYNYFSFFPWAAFLAFGLAGGSVLRLTASSDLGRLMQWSAIGGLVIWALGRYAADLPYSIYPKSNFWLDSPLLVFVKMGLVQMLMALAFVWTRYIASPGWSVVQQVGSTSLLVYWVHIELVYGRWLGDLKEVVPVGQTALLAVLVIGLMAGISVLRTGWGSLRPVSVLLKERLGMAQPLPSPAAGD